MLRAAPVRAYACTAGAGVDCTTDDQCTGAPAYAGEQDNDPRTVDECAAGSAQDTIVRAAELQVFEH